MATYKIKSENTEVEEQNQVESKEKVVQEKPITSFVMVKNYRGGLAVELEPYDFSAPARKINFRFNQEKQHVPLKWALGVFVTDSAMSMLGRNYFTFENLEKLIQMAEEKGLYVPDSIKEPKVTSKELQKIISKNDLTELKRVMVGASKTKIADMVALARKVLPKLNYETIQYIENTYKVTLKTVDLNG